MAIRPSLSEGALKPPLFQTSTFVFRNAEEGKASFELAYGLREKRRGEEMHLIYSRINNPNLEVLEDRLAVWDGAEKALAFASGMAAISTTLMTFLRPGDSFVFSEPVYGGTEFLVHNILPQFGVKGVGFMAEGGEAGFPRGGEGGSRPGGEERRQGRRDLCRDARQPDQRPRRHRAGAARSRKA